MASKFIHEALKCRGSIKKSKGHYQKIILAFMCVEWCLQNIGLFHYDLVASGTKLEFGEKIGTMELIQDIINDWDTKFIFDGERIDGLKLWTQVASAFFL